MLSVLIFLNLNRLRFLPPDWLTSLKDGAPMAVRSVSAIETSEDMAERLLNGTVGGGKSDAWGGVVGGVTECEESDGDVRFCFTDGAVDAFFVAASLSKAFLSRDLSPFFTFSGSGDAVVAWDKGDGRELG